MPDELEIKPLTLKDVAAKIRGISAKLSEKNAKFVFRTASQIDDYAHVLEDTPTARELSFLSMVLGVCGSILEGSIEEHPSEVQARTIGSVKSTLDRLADAVEHDNSSEIHSSLRDLYVETHKLTYLV